MLSNKSLQEKNPKLLRMTLEELSDDNTLIADIIKKASDREYLPPSLGEKFFNAIAEIFH